MISVWRCSTSCLGRAGAGEAAAAERQWSLTLIWPRTQSLILESPVLRHLQVAFPEAASLGAVLSVDALVAVGSPSRREPA